jgi:hypothetical protein
MSRNVNVPTLPEGTYYMIVSVDGPNNVDEISNANNKIAAAFQLVKPDLVPTSATADVTVLVCRLDDPSVDRTEPR